MTTYAERAKESVAIAEAALAAQDWKAAEDEFRSAADYYRWAAEEANALGETLFAGVLLNEGSKTEFRANCAREQ